MLLIFLQNTYETLLQQENEGQTYIHCVLSCGLSKGEQDFIDLNSVLKALSLDQLINGITFIKEAGALLTYCVINYFYVHVYHTLLHPLINIQTVVQEAGVRCKISENPRT